MKWFEPLSESLKFLLKLIHITFFKKGAKIKSQIDVDLFTYIWLSKITLTLTLLAHLAKVSVFVDGNYRQKLSPCQGFFRFYTNFF